MLIKTLSSNTKHRIKGQIKMLLLEKIEEVIINDICPKKIIEILIEMHIIKNSKDFEIESNGRKCDYWIDFVYEEKVYSIKGTAYDGTLEIRKKAFS